MLNFDSKEKKKRKKFVFIVFYLVSLTITVSLKTSQMNMQIQFKPKMSRNTFTRWNTCYELRRNLMHIQILYQSCVSLKQEP